AAEKYGEIKKFQVFVESLVAPGDSILIFDEKKLNEKIKSFVIKGIDNILSLTDEITRIDIGLNQGWN
ncbi:MAG: hypothetical protein MHPSP_004443, partial [Paramarteilia canceri]